MKIWKPKELATFLWISRTTLIRWHNDGKLVANKLPNGRRFYTQEQVDKILQGGK
jgi:predicted site-specific integrase-resolvase